MERRIPPLALLFLFSALMWWYSTKCSFLIFKNDFTFYSSILAFSIGTLVLLYAVGLFRKNDTTVDPTNLGKTTTLVKEGIYRFTRNPMYLGFLLILLGWGLYLGTESLLFCYGFILYLNHFQIKDEEKELEKIFGKDYLEYKDKVGRWLSF